MPDKNGVFVDSLIAVALRDGVVRLEFGEFEGPSSESDGKKAPEVALKYRLLMPLPGFVRSVQVMQEVMKRLEAQKQGVGSEDSVKKGQLFVAEAAKPLD